MREVPLYVPRDTAQQRPGVQGLLKNKDTQRP